jgi:serine phosphatase RsbU (regulator of sigma subunit)
MEVSKRRQTTEGFISLGVYSLLIALTIFNIWERKLATLEPAYIINITADLFAMILGAVLFICLQFDFEKHGPKIKYFRYLLNVSFLGAFTDACAWLVDGLPEMRVINIIDNTFYYACSPIQVYFLWLYMSSFVKLEKKIYKTMGTIIHIGMSIALILRLLNLIFGQYFTVGADGYYARGNMYALSNVYTFATLIAVITVVVIERKQLKSYQIAAFFIYAFGPLIVGIFTAFVYGLSIIPGFVMLILLLIYCVLNISQGRAKAVADHDLMMASKIQESVLPRMFPYLPERCEFDVFASMTPAKEVGGDFYDFFMIDDDHLAMVMADVSGKGIPASLFMMISRTMIKNYALVGNYSTSKILHEVNNRLCEGNQLEMFVTVWIGIVSLSTGKGIASNAGHEHPALYRNGGQFELVKYRHSMAVAAMEDMEFEEHEFQLNPGDALFIYTDGVAEANDAMGNLFGSERLVQALNKDPAASAKGILIRVQESIDAFVKNADQFDDITMLAFRYFGPDATDIKKSQND